MRRGLWWASWLLVLAGFFGPWLYGPLGKSSDFGWQPVWGLLLRLVPANLFIILAVINCFCYVELTLRRGVPPLIGILRWVGGFFGLLILPLLWFVFDQTGRGSIALHPDGTLGWGAWLALVGLILQVVALRLTIAETKIRN